MTGKPTAASLLKRPVVVASFAIVVASAAGVGAWVSGSPEDAPEGAAVVALTESPSPRSPATPARPPVASLPIPPARPPVASLPIPPMRPPTVSAETVAAPPRPAPAPVPATPPPPPRTDLLRVPAAEPAPTQAPPSPTSVSPTPGKSADWTPLPIDEVRSLAEANDIAAMEELARRLVQGVGVPKDQQAGAGWLLRAAQAGSAQSAFNVAVMYERGFGMERNAARAVAWYRRAVEGNLVIAKHNLALMLRDGKGFARDGKEAVELLQSAARQGMAASMFSLGDIHERGDAASRDLVMALAWYAITAEFERQTNGGGETALAKTSAARAQTLRRGLTPEDLQKAEKIGQEEFGRIVAAVQRPAQPQVRLAPVPPVAVATAIPPPPPPRRGAFPPLPPPDLNPPDWPKARRDQVRIIQQALFELKLLRDRPDGALGPMTRAAIRTYQRINTQRETGEPTQELYAALKEAVAHRDHAPPAKPEAQPEAPVAVATARPPETAAEKIEPLKPIVFAAAAPPPPPPNSDDIARLRPAPPEPLKPIERAAAETTPPPSTSVDIKKLMPPLPAPLKPIPLAATAAPPPPTSADILEAAPVNPGAWPPTAAAQVRAVQGLLREMRFYESAPDGRMDPKTRAAIREYEGLAGLKITGEATRDLFDSLKEMQLLMKPRPKGG